MFWGLTAYSNDVTDIIVPENLLCFATNVALDIGTITTKNVQLLITNHKNEASIILLCTLSKTIPQVSLKLCFSSRDKLSLTVGGGTVHLTGYFKYKQTNAIGESSDEEYFDLNNSITDNEGESRNLSETSLEKVMEMKEVGDYVILEDIMVGNGTEIKSGDYVQIFYEYLVKINDNAFRKITDGRMLKFRIGNGEVLKGWDIGLIGMKVCGKRRIICLPHMPYLEARYIPEEFQPNATFVCDIQILSAST